MSLKAKVEAIIYATEEPVTLNELAILLKDAVLSDLQAEEQARLALNETISDGAPVGADADDSGEASLKNSLLDNEPGAPEESATSAESTATETSETLAEAAAPPASSATGKDQKQAQTKEELKTAKARLSMIIDELIADYSSGDRGMEIRQIAGGYRMATKPEHHDAVVNFAKSLKPPVRLSLQALETLAVIAYKQPVTVPEISEIRGVDSAGVIATLLDRKLITTSGRKQVIGRPILYKTTKEFLMRFGLNDVAELPSVEEFEKLGDPQTELFSAPAPETSSANASTPSDDEPVTEAVPEPGSHLMGDSTMPADGTYATEAQPGDSGEKS
jgi:segregation and condensation protein B